MAEQKIGILGGTFNPIHNGHIELATAAFRQFGLDKVLVMPNNKPAYKAQDKNISNRHRAEMIQLAIAQIEGLQFSSFELNRPGITYTYETLYALYRLYPHVKWHFIMGGDSIMYFEQWKNPELIVKYATLIVTIRDDLDADIIYGKIKELKLIYPDCKILFEDINAVDISSSRLRDMICQGLDVSEYMDKKVIEYIQKNRLYLI